MSNITPQEAAHVAHSCFAPTQPRSRSATSRPVSYISAIVWLMRWRSGSDVTIVAALFGWPLRFSTTSAKRSNFIDRVDQVGVDHASPVAPAERSANRIISLSTA